MGDRAAVKLRVKRGQIYFQYFLQKILKINLSPFYVLLLIVPMQSASAFGIYLSRKIEGTIINAVTKAPIEGVIVTASWELDGILSGVLLFHVSETVTDGKGEYTLPGWGPKFYGDILNRDQPLIRFFKPGYVPLAIFNNRPYHPGLEGDIEHMIKKPERFADGKIRTRLFEPEAHQVKFGKKKNTFMLEPFKGTDEEYVEVLDDKYVDYTMRFEMMSRKDCIWKQLPMTFTTLHKLKAELDKKNVITYNLPGLSSLGGQKQQCGSADEYFREYLK